MKTKIFNPYIFIVILLLGCKKDFLVRKPDDQMTEAQVFADYEKVNKLVTDLYSDLHSRARGLAFLQHFSLSAITDECRGSTVENGQSRTFNTGGWNPSEQPGSGYKWADIYSTIRISNLIISGVRKYSTPDNPLNKGDLDIRRGETYFMRAWYHYLAARLYGEVPYIDFIVDPNGDLGIAQETFHSVVEKISADCDSAIALLPVNQTDPQFARAEKGTALALKAIVRWMAATPLYNGGILPNDTRKGKSSYHTRDNKRWEAARDAAKAVLDLRSENGQLRYNLYTGYGTNDFVSGSNNKVYSRLFQQFYDFNAFKQEGIFMNMNDKWEAWQGDNYPPSEGGGSRQQPAQEQVDEYEYIAPDGYGYPVYDARAVADGYDDANPYESVKRDPRFYRDVIYHGSSFRNAVRNTATGSDKIGATNSTTTGYFLRKFYREDYRPGNGVSFQIHYPLIRLPEIMLIYAEALNETGGSADEIFTMLNTIRQRAFMAPVPPAVKGDKDKTNEYIQRERRVEFFFENKRWFTARLYLEPSSTTQLTREQAWQSAGSDNDTRSRNFWPYPKCQRMVNGMKPVEDPNGKINIGGKTYRMERFYVATWVFVSPTHFFFPVMQDELIKNPVLQQAPGW
ncbi:RagB/SusD family nutrient uptake outer membrane protein [Niastella populi]|uniref:Starch-binding protein n=1 Tax=Niastella populi TaxID=550983 RepID=A0A1V9FI43_9BACT|nr:RagB/SusD family nutrient uptake outer membrane protein [Niastella populi]OQP58000.1 starch-binding protein [Niastella populi]